MIFENGGRWMDRKDSCEKVIDSGRKSIENNEKIRESIAPLLEQQKRTRQIVDTANGSRIDISSSEFIENIRGNSAVMTLQENESAVKKIYENGSAIEMLDGRGTAIETSQDSSVAHESGEIAIKFAFSDYQFESSVLRIFDESSKNIVTNLATGLTALIVNPVMKEIQSITSDFGRWLQNVDFYTLTNVLESIRDIGFDFDHEEVNDVFLKAMFNARWFPYAGWIADFRIVDAMLEILNTSRDSKNRVNRIDRLFFFIMTKKK